MPSKPKRPPLDWEAIEREYRAGQLSVTEIGRQYGCSKTAIQQRAKKWAWTRNLTAAVQLETQRRLTEMELAGQVAAGNAREVVDSAAARGVEIVTIQRKSLRRLIERVDRMFDLLEREDKDGPGLEPKDIGGLLRDCSTALAKAIPLQRQAYNIGTGLPEEPVGKKFDFGKLTDEQLDALAEITDTATRPA